MKRLTKLEVAMIEAGTREIARKARFERVCNKLIASGKLTLVDLDAGTVEHIAPVTLGGAA